jgi:tRNA threonylcarbamoyladenosine biosynthesis protein TsaB
MENDYAHRLAQLLTLAMLVLFADTSGKQGSIALARAGEALAGAVEIVEQSSLAGGMFSAQMIPQVAAMLEKHRLTRHEIGAFVAVTGPGSFTGLRVGLAAIKGLAEVLGKPIAAVSLLEVLALTSGLQGKLKAVLDAGRGEFYLGDYEIAGDSAVMLSETLVSQKEIPVWQPGLPFVTSDRKIAELLAAGGLAASVCGPINATDIVAVGWKKICAGQTVTPDQLDASYIWRADAEMFPKPRA